MLTSGAAILSFTLAGFAIADEGSSPLRIGRDLASPWTHAKIELLSGTALTLIAIGLED